MKDSSPIEVSQKKRNTQDRLLAKILQKKIPAFAEILRVGSENEVEYFLRIIEKIIKSA